MRYNYTELPTARQQGTAGLEPQDITESHDPLCLPGPGHGKAECPAHKAPARPRRCSE